MAPIIANASSCTSGKQGGFSCSFRHALAVQSHYAGGVAHAVKWLDK